MSREMVKGLKELQKEINLIAKCKNITGEIYIEIEVSAKSYEELDEKIESILNNLIVPEGLKKDENLIYRKYLKIYIYFKNNKTN
jgi:hypothetical protein